MGFRSLAFGLLVTAAALLLAACQGASTQPPASATTNPASMPTLPPSPTAVPTSTSTPEESPANSNVPAATNIAQHMPSPQPTTSVPAGEPTVPATPPTAAVPTGEPTVPATLPTTAVPTGEPGAPSPNPTTSAPTGEPPAPATQPTNGQRQAQNSVFYEQNGLTLEYYWPLDDSSNLSADETEILAYNESDEAIEFVMPQMTFTEGGSPRAQISGTWEKYPSRNSWDRIEYISIPPSLYQGEPLLLQPGEKAKIHWHLEGITSTDTNQSVALDLTVTTGARTETITQTLVRDSEQRTSDVAIATEPTQEPHETQQSTNNDAPAGVAEATETPGTASAAETTPRVRWLFNGTSWSPNSTQPDCSEPFVVQTPVDMDLVVAALWPGQVRGAYVAHGGFRFDPTDDNNVTVRAPVGSHLVQASQYLESGQKQYLLFFSVPCGFFYRFDHVRVVSPKLADALEDLPPAISGNSATTYVNPPVWVEEGEVVGTSVGIFPSNIFVDFGLYDVRTPNNIIPNPAWADLYAADKEFGHYGVCFFDYLPGNHGKILRSLPTGQEGKTSDFCD